MMRKLVLLLGFAVLLAFTASADNSTNSTPNYNLTFCDNISLNTSVHWDQIFVCDMNSTLFACCNNETLCEDIWQTNCSPIIYLLPFFNQPGGDGDDGSGDDGSGDGNDNGDGNSNPASSNADALRQIQQGNPRAMHLSVSGEYVGEPLRISANNIFGALANVELKFYKDDKLVKTVMADGKTDIIFDEPGAYVVKAYRAGYIPTTSRLFLYNKPSDQPAPPEVYVEPAPVEVIDPTPEPAKYDKLSSMVTVTSPKEKLNIGRALLIGLGAIAVLGVVAKMLFRKTPPKEEEKINWNF
ncbi:hypothetical protein KY329_04530 [Candidatus Woesearchaeota archaeon]|nr:hypothetical protein [Candidatus Woesearchaeota archaeon]